MRVWAKLCVAAAAAGIVLGATGQIQGAAAAEKLKIFLSMSYIGNDWQAEAANMVKAMAAHKDFADKVDLQVQVAGPNAQRQIQQINAMVQAGAKAIVVYPISPTALNGVVKNACEKGVVIIAYDSEITEPCAYNVSIDQEEAGRVTAEWLVKKLNGKGNIVVVTGVPGTSVDTLRTKAAKEVFDKSPGIKIVAEAVGMWSQAVARTELSKILATHNWDQIDGLWMQVGCYTANTMQIEAGKTENQLKPCAGEGSNGGRIQMLPIFDRGRGRERHLSSDGRAAHLVRLSALFGRAGAEARRGEAPGQEYPEADQAAAATRYQRDDQAVQRRHLAGDERRLQRFPAVAGAQSGLVRLDLLGADAGDRLPGRADRPARNRDGGCNESLPSLRRGRRPPHPDPLRPRGGGGPAQRRGEVGATLRITRYTPATTPGIAIGLRAAAQDLRSDGRRRQCQLRGRRRRGACAARRERRRQVDHRQAAERPHPPRCRRNPHLRERHAPHLAARRASPLHPDGVSGDDADPGSARPRQHAAALRADQPHRHDQAARRGSRGAPAFRRARPRHRFARRGARPRSRGEAEDRDRPRSLPRAAHPLARRADLDPVGPRRRMARRHHRARQKARHHHHLHLASSARGQGVLRHADRAAQRPAHRDGAGRRARRRRGHPHDHRTLARPRVSAAAG